MKNLQDIVSELLKKRRSSFNTTDWKHNLKNMKRRIITGTIEYFYLMPNIQKRKCVDCRKYRGIPLFCTAYKVLSNVSLHILISYTKEIVGEYQTGFTKGKSTLDQTHIAKQLMEKMYVFNQDLFLLFIDYKQAYDSINRKCLWAVMLKIGILEKIVKLTQTCIPNSKSRIRYNHQMPEEFHVKTSLRQCDPISSMYLYILY